jgi:small-conductance mechanosensitive channel
MQEFLDYIIFKINEDIVFTVRSIILIIVGYLLTKLIVYLTRRVLKAYFNRRKIDVGRSYTIVTLVKYVIYIIAFLTIMNLLGIKLNYLLAGSAALLVGIGIGLQSTFNDFFSGLILLVDGTLEVGDILLINDKHFKVKYIGIRTSKLIDVRNHLHIIPNSQLVNNKVDNLTDSKLPVRFHIDIGVAYGSDIKLVEETLLKVIKPFNKYKMSYMPTVFLTEYGDSAIKFRLTFYSKEIFTIEKTLSDIRKELYYAFKQRNIEIPFPQQDVWIRTENTEEKVKSQDSSS